MPSEKLIDFGYDLRRLAKKAFPNQDECAKEEWLLDQFRKGLN